MRDRSENNGLVQHQQPCQEGCIDRIHIAHKTIVDLRVDPLMGQDTVPVGAGETDCVTAAGLQPCDDILVDRSCIDHRDDLQCFRIGDPPPVDQLLSDTQSFRDLRSQLSAAMHQNLFSRDRRKSIQEMRRASPHRR